MDATAPGSLIYQPAIRKKVGVLIMLAGPSGSGKTLTALILARGMAGPGGKICFCDTENDRALYYAAEPGKENIAADQFEFSHLSIPEPFRPAKFEEAAIAAQQQKADVWICDSFSHEHVGPGGLLDYHNAEMDRMLAAARKRDGNLNEFEARERLKAAAWIAPKGEHKHMLQRLWQLNANIILCCQAEKKIAMIKQTQGARKGKTDWVDQGFQPVCGPDIPYAMTMSFLFDVAKPGVPIVIKPLLRDLAPLIDLTRPITVETGQRIAAWARGASSSPASNEAAKSDVAPARPRQTAPEPPPESPPMDGPPPEPPPASADEYGSAASAPPPVSPANHTTTRNTRANHTTEDEEARIVQGAKDLGAKFETTKERRDHLVLVDDADNHKQIEWLKRHRKAVYAEHVEPKLKASWTRTDVHNKAKAQDGLALEGTKT